MMAETVLYGVHFTIVAAQFWIFCKKSIFDSLQQSHTKQQQLNPLTPSRSKRPNDKQIATTYSQENLINQNVYSFHLSDFEKYAGTAATSSHLS